MEHLTLKIEGMHCGSCATSIQMYLSTQDGVKDATVDYNAKKGELDIDPEKVNLDKILSEIKDLGFTATKV